jgi:predicted dehydrogenase
VTVDPTASEPLRIGVLGASRIAPEALLKPAHELAHRVVAVAARDRAKAEQYATEHGIERVLASYGEVITDPDVEVVYNPLPNAQHAPFTLAAIAAGKHVIVEKPFASNAAEAIEVRDAARAAGVVVLEAFHYLYHPLMRHLETVLDSGELGDLRRVDITMVMPPPPDGDLRWSWELAGGSVMDVGCYAVHLARHLGRWAGGEPRVVSGSAETPPGSPYIDAALTATVEYPDGLRADLRSGMTSDDVDFSFRIEGTRGVVHAPMFVKPSEDERLVITVDGEERVEHCGTRPSYSYQLEAFAAAVRSGSPLRNDLDDAVAQMQLVDACYQAAGLPVRPRASDA